MASDASNQEKVSKTVVTYLRALAGGDTAKACAQLTRRAQGARCQQVLKERRSRLDPNALTSAADASLDLNIHGNTATAGLSDPDGARLLRQSRRRMVDRLRLHARPNAPVTNQKEGFDPADGDLTAVPVPTAIAGFLARRASDSSATSLGHGHAGNW